MELNNNLPKKACVDHGPYGEHRHCAPQEDLERLADDMALLAEAIRKGVALDGYGAMRKLTEKVLHEFSKHACGRDYTSLSCERSHSLPEDSGGEDKLPSHSCRCRCPLEGDAFYDDLYEQIKIKLKMHNESVVDDIFKRIETVIRQH